MPPASQLSAQALPAPRPLLWSRQAARYLSLLFLPLLWWGLGTWYTAARGPYYLGLNQDPEYTYLANSLLVATSQTPWHVDNPGTPLQEFGGLVMWLRHALVPPPPGSPAAASLADDALRQPEAHLHAIHALALALVAVLLAVTGLAVYRQTRQWGLALAVQATLWIAPTLAAEATRVRPEVLLPGVGLLLALVLLPVSVGSPRPAFGYGRAVALGVVLALGLALKFTFLPLLLLLGVPPLRRHALTALGAFMVAFPLWLWPALPRHAAMEDWVLALATHRGPYGGGAAGLPPAAELTRSFLGLLAGSPVFFLAVALAMAVVGWSRWRARPAPGPGDDAQRLPILLLLAMVAQVVMVVKHPGDHYLVPAMSLAGPLLLALWGLTDGAARPAAARRTAHWLAGAVLATGMAGTLVATLAAGHAAQMRAQIMADFAARVPAAPAGRVISYYRCSSPRYALSFANGGADYAWGSVLSRAYPDELSFSSYERALSVNFGVPVDLRAAQAELARGNLLWLWGSTITAANACDFPFRLTWIDGAGGEAVYRLEAVLPQGPAEVRGQHAP